MGIKMNSGRLIYLCQLPRAKQSSVQGSVSAFVGKARRGPLTPLIFSPEHRSMTFRPRLQSERKVERKKKLCDAEAWLSFLLG